MKKLLNFLFFYFLVFPAILVFTEEKSFKKDSFIIKADKKKYFEEYKTWSLLDNVEIKVDNNLITSNRAMYNPEKEIIEILNNVNIMDYKESIEIFSDKVIYEIKNFYVKILGNPKIISHKDSFQIFSEIIEHFGKDEIYLATGNVKIKIGDLEVFAKECFYEIPHKRIRLIGNPKIFDKKNLRSFKGSEIIFYPEKNHITIKGAVSLNLEKENIKASAEKMDLFFEKEKEEFRFFMYTNVEILFFSKKNSFLKGEPYLILKSDSLEHFQSEFKQIGNLKDNVSYTQYYVEDSVKENYVEFKIKKRGGTSNYLEYERYLDQKKYNYKLIGDAQIYDDEYLGFADKIYFLEKEKDRKLFFEEKAFLYKIERKSENYKENLYDFLIAKKLPASIRKKYRVLEKIKASKIYYHIDKDEIILKENVLFEKKDMLVSGNYLRYQVKAKKGYIQKDASFQDKKNLVKAGRIFFFEEKKEFIADGNAFYKNSEIEVRAKEIHYSEKLNKALLKGDVEFIAKQITAYAHKVFYQKEKDSLIKAYFFGSNTYGRPKVERAEQVLKGNFMEYIQEDDLNTFYIDGNVLYYSKDNDRKIYANSMVYYDKELEADITIDEIKRISPELSEKEVKNLFYTKIKNNFKRYLSFQKNVQVKEKDQWIQGEQAEYFIYENEEKAVLSQDCRFYHASRFGFSDALYFFQKKNKDETDESNEPIVHYQLSGDVEFFDAERHIKTETAFYYPKKTKDDKDKMLLIGKSRVDTEYSSIETSKMQILFKDEKNYFFEVLQPGTYKNLNTYIQIKADYFSYDPDIDILKARGNINYLDLIEKIKLYSENITRFQKENISVLSGNIKLEKEDLEGIIDDKKDKDKDEKDKNKKDKIKDPAKDSSKTQVTFFGEQAKYNEVSKKLTILGNASLVDEKQNIVKANKIEVKVENKDLKIIGVERGQYDLNDPNKKKGKDE